MKEMRNASGKPPIKQRKRKKRLRKPIKLMLIIIPLLLIGGIIFKIELLDGHFYQHNTSKENSSNFETKPQAQPEVKKELTQEEIIRNFVSRLSLDERIGQTIIIDLTKLNNGTVSQELTDVQIKNIQNYHVGGITFFANNIVSETQVKTYVSNLQKNSKTPLFISIDEEGGTVSRIGGKAGFKFPVFPSMQKIGATGDASKARDVGNQLGSNLKGLGFNLDFAPVSDVNTNPKNPVIGERAFSSNQNVVAVMVSEEVKGMQKHNVSATLKHFPGHGDTMTDTHHNLTVSDATYERLKQIELVPFQAGIKADVDFVMMSHVNMRNISKDQMPASMSAPIIKDILRRDLGFSKLIITDSLQMGAITQNYKSYQVGVNCLRAGVDILLMPESLADTVTGIKDAITKGSYTENDLNESVYKILKTKVARGILSIDQLK